MCEFLWETSTRVFDHFKTELFNLLLFILLIIWLQHCAQKSRHVSKLAIFQQMVEKKICFLYFSYHIHGIFNFRKRRWEEVLWFNSLNCCSGHPCSMRAWGQVIIPLPFQLPAKTPGRQCMMTSVCLHATHDDLDGLSSELTCCVHLGEWMSLWKLSLSLSFWLSPHFLPIETEGYYAKWSKANAKRHYRMSFIRQM